MRAATLVTALLTGGVSAGTLGNVAHLARGNSVEESMRRYVDKVVQPIDRRQAPPPAAAAGVDMSQWDAMATLACTTTLESLNGQASNPSGIAVCYNLPFLDKATGVFQAELRLYTISPPTGNFASIAAKDINVGLTYNGATVSAVNASAMGRRSEIEATMLWPRGDGIEKRQSPAEPTLSQFYAFVGQINKELLAVPMGTDALQKVLVPAVTLKAVNSTGQLVNTTLSSQEATFVAGVFSTQVVPTRSQLAPPIQTLVVTGDQPFVVPGLNILIFPIGAVITGVWAILLIATIGLGTFRRMQFRENFRRRQAREMKGGLARI
ncbi:Uncharacterized protein BP5553_04267 [Venustampulla echinocandica]|uniref:Uncharacterized protein n=1 Tax=Venustampulla echinocandica TaxID=2656787 RepID=A0A370TWM2_9HELO|nr:Uncharacterized protein BP5553_04267 [Venustampulla echinocandica]RDL39927.1 Uncharacterized protein BP5553_04267 [Venustampulla echinocandica]